MCVCVRICKPGVVIGDEREANTPHITHFWARSCFFNFNCVVVCTSIVNKLICHSSAHKEDCLLVVVSGESADLVCSLFVLQLDV